MLRCSLHNHTCFADGRHTVEEMAAEAFRLGCRSFGLSEHSPFPPDPPAGMPSEAVKPYREAVLACRERYAEKMEIVLGLEQDIYSPKPEQAYDYIIGSVHYVCPGNEFVSVDISAGETRRIIRTCYENDPLMLAEDYYRTVAKLPQETNCGVIGHFDLVTKYNERDPLFDTDSVRYRRAVGEALDALLPKDLIFEVNTGAMAKGYRTRPYPDIPILKELRARGARIMLSSDAHRRQDILFAFPETLRLLSYCGFREVTVWDDGGWNTAEIINSC